MAADSTAVLKLATQPWQGTSQRTMQRRAHFAGHFEYYEHANISYFRARYE